MKGSGWHLPMLGAGIAVLGGILNNFSSSSAPFALLGPVLLAAGGLLALPVEWGIPQVGWDNRLAGFICGLTSYCFFQFVFIAFGYSIHLGTAATGAVIAPDAVEGILLGTLIATLIAMLPLDFVLGRWLMSRAISMLRAAAWSAGTLVALSLFMQVLGWALGQAESLQMIQRNGVWRTLSGFFVLAVIMTVMQLFGAVTTLRLVSR